MDKGKLSSLQRQVKSLFKNNQEGNVIEFLVNNEVKGEYTIPQNHYIEIDSKSPTDWLNGCICFEVELKGMSNANISLKIRK